MSFQKDFLWGAASASYQIEGGAFEDGRGPSIWDHFSHTPGNTFGGQTGDVSCDAYHRFEEDLDLLAATGAKVYRFSISWSRILPSGIGEINPLGLVYYDKVVDGCIARGIEPWITLYHWDLPLELHYKGGWLNRDTAYAFAEYAKIIVEHFKDRVTVYTTLNEPQCIIGCGYIDGFHAPGFHLCPKDSFRAWHHLLLAHGLAAQEIKQAKKEAKISIASTGNLVYVDGTPEFEKQAASSEILDYAFKSHGEGVNRCFNHQWFMEPVLEGHYPDDPDNFWNPYKNDFPDSDLEIIHSDVDFICLNIYNAHEIKKTVSGDYEFVEKYPGYPRTALKWPVTPKALYWGPKLVYERYGKPIVISENGQSCNDKIFLDGKVHDLDRIDFLHRYLKEYMRASEDGIPLIAYLHWSLTDNLEWHSGYDDRFGLIFIDYETQKRIPKDSYYWYKEVIASNGDTL